VVQQRNLLVMAVYAVALILPAMVTGLGSMVCPGSGSGILPHAWIEVYSVAYRTSCTDVAAEIQARAKAQSGWVDPHNGGIYSFESIDPHARCDEGTIVACTEVRTKRTANPKKSVGGKLYVDKQVFTMRDTEGDCSIAACSESQGASVGDFSTNYCDLRNLYCGKADGCAPVSKDFNTTELAAKKSFGAGHDFTKCVVKTPPAEAVPQYVELIALDQLQKKSENVTVQDADRCGSRCNDHWDCGTSSPCTVCYDNCVDPAVCVKTTEAVPIQCVKPTEAAIIQV